MNLFLNNHIMKSDAFYTRPIQSELGAAIESHPTVHGRD